MTNIFFWFLPSDILTPLDYDWGYVQDCLSYSSGLLLSLDDCPLY